MPFSKFDPYREEPEPEVEGRGRVWLLKWGWWITLAYTALGFVFIVYWLATGRVGR